MTTAPGTVAETHIAHAGKKIVVIGGGSAFVPGVFRGLIHRAADLPGSEVVLYDEAGIVERCGGPPSQYVLLAALRGGA